MTKARPTSTRATQAFGAAIAEAEHLQLRPGLQALVRSEGASQVLASNPKKLLGSANIDRDCRAAHPQATRWDYVIGYERSGEPVAHFVEVHSAETSEVSKMSRKLNWLCEYLAQPPQAKLARLRREFHWVQSGRFNIPKTTPQYRLLQTTLRKRGLNWPVARLTLD